MSPQDHTAKITITREHRAVVLDPDEEHEGLEGRLGDATVWLSEQPWDDVARAISAEIDPALLDKEEP